MKLQNAILASAVFLLLALPTATLAFLNFSSLNAAIFGFYILLCAWFCFSFVKLPEPREVPAPDVPTPSAPQKDSFAMNFSGEKVIIYPEPFLGLRLQEEYDRAKRYQRPFSCLLIELEAGARNVEAEKEAAKQLRKILRSVDIIVKRHEKQLFVILPETGLNGARITAQRIQFTFDKAAELSGAARVYIGITPFDPAIHSAPEEILKSLERVLLEAPKNPNRIGAMAEDRG